MRPFSIIVGYRASDRAIGANGNLPWIITKDMEFFRKTTTYVASSQLPRKNVVIMGRATFESMRSRPLGGRMNIVCTSLDMIDMPDMNLYFVKSLDAALEKCRMLEPTINKIFVIGGEKLYRHAIKHTLCDEIIVNEFSPCQHKPTCDLDAIVCDTFFPEIDTDKYDMVLDYNNIDSAAEITTGGLPDSENKIYIKIRYKKFVRNENKYAELLGGQQFVV